MNRWFSHDSNARNSKKLFRVRQRYGAAGYGVYFMLVEMLRDAEGNRLDLDYDMLAFDIREDAGMIKDIVENFGLFAVSEDGLYFESVGLVERLSYDFRSVAGKKGAEARWGKNENRNRMAQNGKTDGKTMANDGKRCDCMPVNIVTVTETKQKEINKETCCCSNVSAVEEGKGISFYALPEEERKNEQQQFFKIFYFKNFKTPEKEVTKYIDHNEKFGWIPRGKNEPLDTPEKRIQWAHGWTVKTQPRVDQPGFMQAWEELYRICERSAPDIAPLMLNERVTAGKVLRGSNYIRCPAAVWQWIESTKEETHPIIRRMFNGENWLYYNI